MKRSLPKLLASTERRAVAHDPLLEEVIASIHRAPIREEQIRDARAFVWGDHDHADGTIRINIALLRVAIALHELVHRVRPRWSERTVRARSLRMLHALTDDDIAAIDRVLVAAMRASR